jgi:GNAT superfamily N-acetyltransferase
VTIRAATPTDVPLILELVRELAEFEELSDHVVCTEEDLRVALFADGAVVHDSIVECDGAVAGHALWFRSFSTFLGTTGIWLEDLYVRPAFRRRGLARELLEHLRAQTSGRVEWEVIDWNAGAIAFYESLGARTFDGWVKYRWTPQR